ncbi:MAG: FtsX-like permease family protein [Bryobacteraceae bacterium]
MNFTRAMLEHLQALPGVRSVAAANLLPLTGQGNLPTQRDGHPEQSIGGMEIRKVTPAYFELMGIPVRRGRSFTGTDAGTSVPVAVVNETLAQRWWPQGGAIGDRLIIGRFHGKEYLKDAPREVIGVVGDTKTMTLKDPPRPTIYVPVTQTDALPVGSLAWIVRTNSSPGLAEQLRGAVAEIDPSQRVQRLRTMDEIVASNTADSRFNATLFALFAGVALALAALGVYGLLTFLVARRRQEIGTRMALGASRADVSKLFLKQGFKLTAIGLAIGLAGGFFVTRLLSRLLYGVSPDDPVSFGMVSLLLLSVGIMASCLPARRAARVDPMDALRYE